MSSGVTQARIFRPRTSPASLGGRGSPVVEENSNNAVSSSSWLLPVWILPQASFSVMQGLGRNYHHAVLHSRIAKQMGIQDGDEVEFELTEFRETFRLPVTIRQYLTADFMIHDAIGAGLVTKAVSNHPDRTTLTMAQPYENSRREEISVLHQELWAGMKICAPRGKGILRFSGTALTTSDDKDAAASVGPAGFAFCLSTPVPEGVEKPLVKGYSYCGTATHNEMVFAGLLEGLQWALRFDFEHLSIQGDSELVILNLLKENNPSMKKTQELIEDAKMVGTEIKLEHVPVESNAVCDALAHVAIDLKENVTACNWKNINEQCARDDF